MLHLVCLIFADSHRQYLSSEIYSSPQIYTAFYYSEFSYIIWMFVDPCIIVQLLEQKTQQDATVFKNFIISYFK
jgi:hypothetical protein